MAEEVRHITINGKYRIQIERAASSTKGILGYKIEINGDDVEQAVEEIECLKRTIERMTPLPEEK